LGRSTAGERKGKSTTIWNPATHAWTAKKCGEALPYLVGARSATIVFAVTDAGNDPELRGFGWSVTVILRRGDFFPGTVSGWNGSKETPAIREFIRGMTDGALNAFGQHSLPFACGDHRTSPPLFHTNS
jgi:hypothetical protein